MHLRLPSKDLPRPPLRFHAAPGLQDLGGTLQALVPHMVAIGWATAVPVAFGPTVELPCGTGPCRVPTRLTTRGQCSPLSRDLVSDQRTRPSLSPPNGTQDFPCPPFGKPTLFLLWAGLPNFALGVTFLAGIAQRSEKTIGAAKLFFYNSKLNFIFPLKGTTLFHLMLKFQKLLIHVFDNVRAYPNFQKTVFGTLVL
jgi:hypothetical protein